MTISSTNNAGLMSFSPRYCVALTSILQHTWAFSLAFLCTSRVITRGDHCARVRSARHSQTSRNPFRAGHVFRGFLIHAFATACQLARPPVRIRPICSAFEGFYFQASNGSVTLPVAGYDYNSDWTPLLAGLSPTGMAASLAAPDPYVRLSRIRLPPGVQSAKQLPHAVRRLWHASLALSPVRALPHRIALGPCPVPHMLPSSE